MSEQNMVQAATASADAPIGHPKAVRSAPSVEQARRNADISRDIFSDRLRWFVSKWAPSDLAERDAFQHDMMRLFVDAMRNQTDQMAFGVETYSSMIMREASMRALVTIMEQPSAKPR